jgi:hypothetical protein
MAPATTPAATLTLGTCFVDDERASKEVLTIQSRDRLFSLRIILDFSEAKPARLSRETIAQQGQRIGLHADFREQRLNLLFRSLERQITHVQFLHGRSPCAFNVAKGTLCEAEETGSRPRAVSTRWLLPAEASAPATLEHLAATASYSQPSV